MQPLRLHERTALPLKALSFMFGKLLGSFLASFVFGHTSGVVGCTFPAYSLTPPVVHYRLDSSTVHSVGVVKHP